MSLITIDEVKKNLREMREVLPEEHVEEIEAMLQEKEEEQYEHLMEELSGVLADGSD